MYGKYKIVHNTVKYARHTIHVKYEDSQHV